MTLLIVAFSNFAIAPNNKQSHQNLFTTSLHATLAAELHFISLRYLKNRPTKTRIPENHEVGNSESVHTHDAIGDRRISFTFRKEANRTVAHPF
jgi:hypothetical protein